LPPRQDRLYCWHSPQFAAYWGLFTCG